MQFDQDLMIIKKNQNQADFLSKKTIKIIRITKESSLSLLTEELILGKIDSIISTDLTIEFSYDPLSSNELSFLCSFFVLNILWKAREVKYNNNDIKEELLKYIWKTVIVNSSRIGDGKFQRIIIREPDCLIPEIFKSNTATSFPHYQAFKLMFDKCINGLFGDDKFQNKSESEKHVISFLYETSKNSFEHGKFKNKEIVNFIFRGIQFNKIVFNNNEEYLQRKDIPIEIIAYIDSLKQIDKFRILNKILIASVCDLGVGIQNTLPATSNTETPIDIILRAFKRGETRKPSSSAIESGFGLPNVIQAVIELNAYLVITSGNYIGKFDFSIKDTVIKKENFKICDKELGTTFTIFWPHSNESTDQPRLF